MYYIAIILYCHQLEGRFARKPNDRAVWELEVTTLRNVLSQLVAPA